jgi:hypothetical protein
MANSSKESSVTTTDKSEELNNPEKVLYLVCGWNTGASCDQVTEYDEKPFSSLASQWIAEYGEDSVIYIGFEGSDPKQPVVNSLLASVNSSESSVFLAGHSAGADVVIAAIYDYLRAGGDPEKIDGIAVLDAYLNIDGRCNILSVN